MKVFLIILFIVWLILSLITRFGTKLSMYDTVCKYLYNKKYVTYELYLKSVSAESTVGIVLSILLIICLMFI